MIVPPDVVKVLLEVTPVTVEGVAVLTVRWLPVYTRYVPSVDVEAKKLPPKPGSEIALEIHV